MEKDGAEKEQNGSMSAGKVMKEKEKNFVSAVIYVRNNEKTLPDFLAYIYSEMEELFSDFEIICVNDASTDASEEIIRNFGRSKEHAVTLVNMGFLQGTELSMNAGEDFAIGDYVYEFDQAVQTWPDELPEMVYRKVEEGYDIVSACPDERGPVSSRLFYDLFNSFSKLSIKLRTEAFRLVSRRAINRVSAMTSMQVYKKAAIAGSGLKQTFLTYSVNTKYKKKQKPSKERRSLAVDSLILFTGIGYKVAFVMSIVMLVFAAAVGIYTVIVYATGHPVAGWTPIMVFLAIGFFVLFAILTFVIKYLSLILNLSFRRQKYVVQDVERE